MPNHPPAAFTIQLTYTLADRAWSPADQSYFSLYLLLVIDSFICVVEAGGEGLTFTNSKSKVESEKVFR